MTSPDTSAAGPAPKELSLPDVMDALRRRRALVLAAGLLGACAALAATVLFDPPVYESTARVLVFPVTAEPFEEREEGVPDMPDEREVVYSDAVASEARERTGWDAPLDAFRDRMRVTVAGGTDVLAITYRATSPSRSATGAQAFADAYLSHRAGAAAAARGGRRRNLISSLTDINRRAAAPRSRLVSASPGSPEASSALASLESLTAEAAPLQDRLADDATYGAGPVGKVLVPAAAPAAPTDQPVALNTGAGALLGLLVGGGVAVSRHRAADQERGRAGLEERLRAPVLVEVPRTRRQAPAGPADRRSWLVTLRLPESGAAEAYRRLRARLLAMAQQRPLRTVLVAGSGDDATNSAIAANLAVSMARTGRRVTLLAANMTSSQIPEALGLDNGCGLADVLAGQVPPGAATRHPDGLDTLEVVVPGPRPDRSDDLLESARMREILAAHGESSDFVVVEAPAALRSTGWLTLAPMVDGVLVVADARHARADELDEVRLQFDQVGAEVVGVVLCNAEAAR